VGLDVHKHLIVAATLSPTGATLELHRMQNSERAIGGFIDRLGRFDGLGSATRRLNLLWLLARLAVACDVIAVTSRGVV
jgi:hypothetical protein